MIQKAAATEFIRNCNASRPTRISNQASEGTMRGTSTNRVWKIPALSRKHHQKQSGGNRFTLCVQEIGVPRKPPQTALGYEPEIKKQFVEARRGFLSVSNLI